VQPHFINPVPSDVYYLILLPLYCDLIYIMLWLNAATIIDAIEGKPISSKEKKAYVAAWLVCSIIVFTFIGLTPVLQGVICPVWWPGSPVTVLIAFMFACLFGSMSQVGATNCCVKCFSRLFLKVWKALFTGRELLSKSPIDSDRALCFYLMIIYNAHFNKVTAVPPAQP
jgi:hypothetical protein